MRKLNGYVKILSFVDRLEALISEDRNVNDIIEDIKKNFPDEIEKLVKALKTYISENGLKILKMEFPNK